MPPAERHRIRAGIEQLDPGLGFTRIVHDVRLTDRLDFIEPKRRERLRRKCDTAAITRGWRRRIEPNDGDAGESRAKTAAEAEIQRSCVGRAVIPETERINARAGDARNILE